MKVKNIVFSGVMGAILMSATGASAAISVASQGYVDAKVGAIETNVTENYLSKTDAADTYLTETQVTEQITNVVGSETEGLIKDVADNKAAIAALDDTYATDTELSEGLATKVDAQAQTAVDAKQTEDISKNAAAIEILNGDAETVGSVKNEIKVLSDLLGGTAGDVSGLTTQVSANTTAIEKLNAEAATIGSVANSIAEALKDYSTTEQVDAKDTATLDAAKAYADGLADNYDAAGSAAAVEAKLADYTKTSELDAGFVSEAEMTSFKSANDTAIAEAKQAGVDAQAEADANAESISQLQTDLATKITAPAACETQDCVLSINKASGTIAWVPLTEPVDDYLE